MNDEKLDKIIALLEELNQRMAIAGYNTPIEMQRNAAHRNRFLAQNPSLKDTLQP